MQANEPEIELSMVLPAYQEADNLRQILPELTEVLNSLDVSWEVLVVDTMEPMDQTREVCQNHPGVVYLNRTDGNHFGDAVRTGISHTKGRYILFMDADGSHQTEVIPQLFSLRGPKKVIVASRYVEGGQTENPKLLIFMSAIVNLVYSFVLRIKCKDVSNSFKLYPGKILRGLTLKSNNFDVVEEILYKTIRQDRSFEIIEVPSVFKERIFGQTKRNLIVFMITYVFSLLKLRFSR